MSMVKSVMKYLLFVYTHTRTCARTHTCTHTCTHTHTHTQFLHWLLDTTSDYSTVHIILWHFVSSLSDDPIEALEAELDKDKEKEKEEKASDEDQSELVLCHHPLTGLEGAGVALIMLREEFHSYLKAVSDQLMQVRGISLAGHFGGGGGIPLS